MVDKCFIQQQQRRNLVVTGSVLELRISAADAFCDNLFQGEERRKTQVLHRWTRKLNLRGFTCIPASCNTERKVREMRPLVYDLDYRQ